MNISVHSIATLIPLFVIVLTALFGLADVKPISHSLRDRGKALVFDVGLAASFLLMGIGALFLALSVLGGTHTVKWPGIVLLYGIAGSFFMIGHYAPWRLWIKRVRP